MTDRLNDHLENIEDLLRGNEPTPVPPPSPHNQPDALDTHLRLIESLITEGGSGGTQIQSGEQTSLVEVTDGVYEVDINAIPYLDTAPIADYTPTQDLVKLVILPKSVESTTVRKNGYIYFFYEDPQTP